MSALTGVGLGLRTPHMVPLAAPDAPSVPWLEIHSENFLCDGGPRLALLHAIAERTPISCHGVGLSLGSAEGLDKAHIARLKVLFARVKPALISEHLSWSVTGGVYLNDLLPFPYTQTTLDVFARNVSDAQDAFGRQMLVENPSLYLTFAGSTLSEPDFLGALVERTGCGLLLDINNVHVSAANTGCDATGYLRAIPAEAVGEIHLAGHSTGADGVLIDTHNTAVSAPVWTLYAEALRRTGPRPTLIEWDRDIPALDVLMREAATAQRILDTSIAERARVA